jgi:hypothetical protein
MRTIEALCDRLDRALRRGLHFALVVPVALCNEVLIPLAMRALESLLGLQEETTPAHPACRFVIHPTGPHGRLGPQVLDRKTGRRWWLCRDWLIVPWDEDFQLERDQGPGWRVPTHDEVLEIVCWDAGGGIGGDLDGAFGSAVGRAVWTINPRTNEAEVYELRDSTREDFWGRTQGGPTKDEVRLLAVLSPTDAPEQVATTTGDSGMASTSSEDTERFSTPPEVWLLDRRTGLEWKPLRPLGTKGREIPEVLAQGAAPWRLPSVAELQSVFESRQSQASLWTELRLPLVWSHESGGVGFRLALDHRDGYAYRISNEAKASLLVVRRSSAT